jgi:type I restriction enzyme, S subunit
VTQHLYNEYKPSGVEWFRELPSHWGIIRLKYLSAAKPFAIVDGPFGTQLKAEDYVSEGIPLVRVSDLDFIGNLSTDNFVYISEKKWLELKRSAIEPGDVIVAKTGATIGKSGLVSESFQRGLIASSCIKVSPHLSKLHPKFLLYLLVSHSSQEQILQAAGGSTRDTINISPFGSIQVPEVPLSEQNAIVDYLDRETARLDSLIKSKERLLDLLAEKRLALTSNVITRGMNPNSPLRDSGIAWLGKIPKHWETERAKWLFKERDERSVTGEEEMLSVSHITGVTPRSEKDVNMFEAETNEGYKVCYAGDLVINTLWAWMGAMGVSPMHGIVSPAYHIYTPCERLDPAYVDALVRIPVFAQEVIRFSKGVWSSRLRLYPEGLYEIYLPVPPLDEQRAIVSHIAMETKKLDALREAAERTIALSKERRAALIAAALTGEIEVGGMS